MLNGWNAGRGIPLLAIVLALVAGSPWAQESGSGVSEEEVQKIQALIGELGAEDWQAREDATVELIRMGTAVAPYLLAAKKEVTDEEVLGRISRVLVETGAWAMDPEEVAARVGPTLALVQTEPIYHFYGDDPESYYFEHNYEGIAEELRRLGEGVGAAIGSQIESSSSPVYRANLAILVGYLPVSGAESALMGLLTDENEDPRRAALWALGQLGGGPDLETIKKYAETDPQATVRLQAMFALGKSREKRIIEWLIEFLDDDSPETRQAAIFWLNRSTGQYHTFNPYYPQARRKKQIEKWRSWWESNRESFVFPAADPLNGPWTRHEAIGLGGGWGGTFAPVPPPTAQVGQAVPVQPQMFEAVVEGDFEELAEDPVVEPPAEPVPAPQQNPSPGTDENK